MLADTAIHWVCKLFSLETEIVLLHSDCKTSPYLLAWRQRGVVEQDLEENSILFWGIYLKQCLCTSPGKAGKCFSKKLEDTFLTKRIWEFKIYRLIHLNVPSEDLVSHTFKIKGHDFVPDLWRLTRCLCSYSTWLNNPRSDSTVFLSIVGDKTIFKNSHKGSWVFLASFACDWIHNLITCCSRLLIQLTEARYLHNYDCPYAIKDHR